MKSKLFTILFLVIPVLSFAQLMPRQIGFGIHGGYNLSEVYFSPGTDDGYLGGITGGVFLNYISEWPAGIQIELNYDQRGWSEEIDSTFLYMRRINYIEVPILSHFKFGKKRMRYTFDLGPYMAFSRGGFEVFDRKDNLEDLSLRLGKDHYLQPIENSFDFGFKFSGGIGVNTVAGELVFRLRYTQSLTQVFPRYPVSDFKYSHEKVYSFELVYSYNIKLKYKLRPKQSTPQDEE